MGAECPGRGAQEGGLKKWVPPKLAAPDRRVTSVGGGEAVQPAAAFAGESLREAQLASTKGGALLKNLGFAFPIGIALSEMLRLKIKSEIRRRLYAAVSLGRSRVNSSVPNSQAKHKSFDRPAASAQCGSVIPFSGMK